MYSLLYFPFWKYMIVIHFPQATKQGKTCHKKIIVTAATQVVALLAWCLQYTDINIHINCVRIKTSQCDRQKDGQTGGWTLPSALSPSFAKLPTR